MFSTVKVSLIIQVKQAKHTFVLFTGSFPVIRSLQKPNLALKTLGADGREL